MTFERVTLGVIGALALGLFLEIAVFQFGVDPLIAPNHQWISFGEPI